MRIKEFIASVAGLSDNTRVAYEQTLWQLHSNINTDEPTNEQILNFLSRYSSSSLHRHKAAIRAYWEFIRPTEAWPFNRRQFSPRREEIIRYVSTGVVMELIGACEDADDAAFVFCLFTLGCRINELMGIEATDISPAGVKVLAKGDKYLLKVVTKEYHEEISRYVKGRKGRIFPRPYNYYYKTLKALGAKVGHPDISPHTLRHARAVDLLDKGANISFIQQFLGHANINTTARYLLVHRGDLGNTLDKIESNGGAK